MLRNKIWGFMLVAAVSFGTIGCGIKMSETERLLWPDKSSTYFHATQKWSREGSIYEGIQPDIKVVALLKSSEWRDAFSDRWAEAYGLSEAEKEAFRADQMRAGSEYTDFILAASSEYIDYIRRIQRHGDPLWRIYLFSDGNKVEPLEVREIKDPILMLREFNPAYSRWKRYFAVRFPHQPAGPVHMKIFGPAGRISLTWDQYN